MENPLRQDLWRAGHAHAGVWLILALVGLRYVDEANLCHTTPPARQTVDELRVTSAISWSHP
jgi:hypothetical protein